ncbi:ty transcription activator TEC1 [Lacrimispora sp. JR3]|uniref:ty transcription activator TEC1 n=1 Tax=Lacrimispora sinapis TaxID=3111456 RepID=UPI003748363A
MEQNKRKMGIRFVVFGVFALAAVFLLLLQIFKSRTKPIFDENVTTTFYAKTSVGTALDLKAENYFSSELYDYNKFRFDLTRCDWNTPGLYRVPVIYEEQETNCVVQIEVGETAVSVKHEEPDLNDNTVITEKN